MISHLHVCKVINTNEKSRLEFWEPDEKESVLTEWQRDLRLDFNTRCNTDVLSTDVQLETVESFRNFKILNSDF